MVDILLLPVLTSLPENPRALYDGYQAHQKRLLNEALRKDRAMQRPPSGKGARANGEAGTPRELEECREKEIRLVSRPMEDAKATPATTVPDQRLISLPEMNRMLGHVDGERHAEEYPPRSSPFEQPHRRHSPQWQYKGWSKGPPKVIRGVCRGKQPRSNFLCLLLCFFSSRTVFHSRTTHSWTLFGI